MNEFENKLIIKTENYESSLLFTKIPNYKKQGSVYLFTDGIHDNIAVNAHTTTRQIRQGKYKQLVEISILPYTKEITLKSSSKDSSFSFDVYVKAVIQVKDPIIFYDNKNIDVDAYFNNLFSLDIKKITRKYSILDYDGMDDKLTKKLSSYKTYDESTGFEYRVSVVDAEPDEEAKSYVRKSDIRQLDAELKEKARRLVIHYTTSYEEAVMNEVAEGILSETDAIIKIENYNKLSNDEKIKEITELVNRGLITESQARNRTKSLLQLDNSSAQINSKNDNIDINNADNIIDAFYDEEE